MSYVDVPVGGCIKETCGTFIQVFDEGGVLMHSEFVAGESDYSDENGVVLKQSDPRTNFYHVFNSVESVS